MPQINVKKQTHSILTCLHSSTSCLTGHDLNWSQIIINVFTHFFHIWNSIKANQLNSFSQICDFICNNRGTLLLCTSWFDSFFKKLLSGQRSGNDCLGRLLGNTGLTSTMQLNDIPDEGEALTSNPLAKRQVAENNKK